MKKNLNLEILNCFENRKLLYKSNISYLDIGINVFCNSYESYQWLLLQTKDVYTYKDCFDNDSISVYCLYDDKEYEKIRNMLSDFEGEKIKTHHYKEAKVYKVNGTRLIDSEATECISYMKNDNIFIIGKGDTKNSLFELSRVVREVFTRKAETKGCFLMHAAALEKDGQVYIFTGEKGAGKTTNLIALMQNGFNLISNDRIFLKIEEGKLICYTWPGAVAVSVDAVERNKNLEYAGRELKYLAYPQQRMTNVQEFVDDMRGYCKIHPEDKFDFTGDEVVSLFDVKYIPSGEVKNVINIYLKQKSKVKDQFLYPVDNSYPNWLLISNDNTYSEAEEKLKEVMGKVNDCTLYLQMMHDGKDCSRILNLIG